MPCVLVPGLRVARRLARSTTLMAGNMVAVLLVVLGLALLRVGGLDMGLGSVQTSVEEAGSKIRLICVLNDTATKITGHRWIKGKEVLMEDTLPGPTTVYEMDVANKTGDYSCLFLPEPVVRADLSLSKSPKVKAVKKSEGADEGDSITLACKSESFPRVTHWAWYKKTDTGNQEIVNGTQDRFFVNNTESNSQARTKLLIRNLNRNSDGGEYVCNGSTSSGSGSAVIVLHVRSRLAALWPFLGIVAEVLILVSIIFAYEKCQKPEVVVEDDDAGATPLKSSGQHMNNEDKSVRQRNPI